MVPNRAKHRNGDINKIIVTVPQKVELKFSYSTSVLAYWLEQRAYGILAHDYGLVSVTGSFYSHLKVEKVSWDYFNNFRVKISDLLGQLCPLVTSCLTKCQIIVPFLIRSDHSFWSSWQSKCSLKNLPIFPKLWIINCKFTSGFLIFQMV